MKTQLSKPWPYLALALCAACAAPQPVPPPVESPGSEAAASRSEAVDFSGSWELDYRRSDNLQQRVRRAHQEMLRQAERNWRASRLEMSNSRMAQEASRELSDAMAAIIPLARLADFITTSQVLEIEQSASEILVEREDTFSLHCNFQGDTPRPVNAALGNELCGWDANQLVFKVDLPEGTLIDHRLSLAPDSQKLHIATTVSRGRNRSFTLNRFYSRFEPLPLGYQCEYTLSRGNVCSRSDF